MRLLANNELALHVADPAAAEHFYVTVMGCTVFERTAAYVGLSNGALHLYLVPDPAPAHDRVIPSFDVADRAQALAYLQQHGCSLVPVGPHAPGEFYIVDPHGVVFDVRVPPAT
ncbi:MAG TPA: VOC family protein [Vicinamibacterales bacterium]